MSVKKDPNGRRSVQVEVEVPGTPEEVWQAIATGPGISSWFVPTEVLEDGTIVSHFGPGMDAVAKRTAWEPPHRFAGEGEIGPNAPKMATEWIVEARSGGRCVVRVVHSLFASTDDWDNLLEGIEKNWPDYFSILRIYLTHFAGQRCSAFQLLGVAPEPASAAWDVLTTGLGISQAAVGERRSSPAGSPPLAGVVECAGSSGHPHQLLFRLDEPTSGVAHLFALTMGDHVYLSIRFYLYGEAAAGAVARSEPIWQAWLSERFPMHGNATTEC